MNERIDSKMQVDKRMQWQPEGKRSSSERSIDRLSWRIEPDWSAEGVVEWVEESVEELAGESVRVKKEEEEGESRRGPG